MNRLALVLITALFSLIIFLANNNTTNIDATTESELKSNVDAINEQLETGEAKLASLESQVDSLQNKLAILATQITQINAQIKKTELELEDLSIQLDKAEAEETRQKGILADNLRNLYINGNVSTLDLILASEDFSDFVNQQEYLDKLKNSVTSSTQKVVELKKQIAADKQKQEDLLAKQQSQKKDLRDNQTAQQELLDKTKGQEAAYQNLVSDLEKQRQQAEKELEDFLAAQNFVSLGHVEKGDVIGRMGNTGFSFGPHLHLGIYKNGSWVNPLLGGTTLIDGFSWPTGSTRITQYFGCGAPYNWYLTKCSNGTSKHTGLDIGASVSGVSGDLVYAIGDGEIVFRGCSGSCSSGYGYHVIIDHGGNVQSYYGHLQN